MIRGVKNVVLGAVFMLIAVLIYNWISNRNEEQEQLDAQTALVLKQVKNVRKLVVTEAQFAKVYTYENTKSYSWDFFKSQKRAIIISNARASIAYDLKKLEYDIDEENRIVRITKIPKPELNIDPKLTFYQLENGVLNKFEADDINTINRQIRNDLRKKIQDDPMIKNSQDRLLSELSEIYLVTEAYGWKLEYDGTEVNSKKEWKTLLD